MTVQPAYTILMSLELGSIGIMYQVTTMADMNLPSTMVIFHFSGVVGCETLLWILLPQLWNWKQIQTAKWHYLHQLGPPPHAYLPCCTFSKE
ncbi:aspartate transaminase aat1 [Trifolium repens]|nr:aspartate transaminase aat1 [Trifolium repens]